MHDDLGHHAKEEVLAKTDGETEACPVVSVLQNFKSIAVEIDISVKVHLIESLYGNLVLAVVLGLVSRIFESEVVLDGSAGVFGLLILSGADC